MKMEVTWSSEMSVGYHGLHCVMSQKIELFNASVARQEEETIFAFQGDGEAEAGKGICCVQK
jgi:hypothetical protein